MIPWPGSAVGPEQCLGIPYSILIAIGHRNGVNLYTRNKACKTDAFQRGSDFVITVGRTQSITHIAQSVLALVLGQDCLPL